MGAEEQKRIHLHAAQMNQGYIAEEASMENDDHSLHRFFFHPHFSWSTI